MSSPNLNLPTMPQGAAPGDISTAFNLLVQLIDMLVQARVETTVTALPVTSDSDKGKSWLVAHSGTTGDAVGHEDEVAMCVGANLWTFYAPGTQLNMIFLKDIFSAKAWNGTSWALSSGIGDAPSDGTPYVRQDAGWVSGGGDTFGPAGAVAGNLAVFGSSTGKLLADGGKSVADIYDDMDDLDAALRALVSSYTDVRQVRSFFFNGGLDGGLVSNSTATGTSFVATTNFQTYTTGTGSVSVAGNDATLGGQFLGLRKGTTATGQICYFITPLRALQAGVMEYMANLVIPTLADGTNRFETRAGYVDRISGAIVNGCYLSSVDNINSGNWTLHCVNAGTDTATDLGVAPTAGAKQQLRLVIAEDGSVGAYINGVLKNTPTAGQAAMAAGITSGIQVIGSVGTSTRDVNVYAQSVRQLWPAGTWA